jgi:hypothetical protein
MSYDRIIKSINVGTVLLLLGSCNHSLCSLEMNGNNQNGNDFKHTESTYSSVNKDIVVLCPSCKGGSRYFYTLSNKEVILCCDECSSVWLEPDKLAETDVVSDKYLETYFAIEDSEELFKDPADWASKEQVLASSKWKDSLAQSSNIHYTLAK